MGEVWSSVQRTKPDFKEKNTMIVCFPVEKMIRQYIFDPVSRTKHDEILDGRGNARLNCLYEMNHGIGTKSSGTEREHWHIRP